MKYVTKLTRIICFGMLSFTMLTACSDSNDVADELGPLTPEDLFFGKATGNFTADEWYPGGKLGTTEKASYSAITPAAEVAGMEEDFNTGEDFFEHLYTFEQAPRKGLTLITFPPSPAVYPLYKSYCTHLTV